MVDAPQERRLAGTGRADQAEHLTRGDLQVDALEDVGGAEGLVDALGLHHGGGHAETPPEGRLLNEARFTLMRCSGVSGSERSEPRA